MITTAVQLAHNILRLSNFDDAGRPLFNNYAAAGSPITTRATYQFIAAIGRLYNVAEPSIDSLGEIFGVSVRAYLHARAYDQTFTFKSFTVQFIASYTATPAARANFIGAHRLRLHAYTAFIIASRIPPSITPSPQDTDTWTKAAISAELERIHLTFDEVVAPLRAVEAIDMDMLRERHMNEVLSV